MTNPNRDGRVAAAVAAVVAVYAAAQEALVAAFSRIIRRGTTPALQMELRKAARAETQRLRRETPDLINHVVEQVSQDTPNEVALSHADRAVQAIRADLQGRLNGLGVGIMRSADDAYRAVVTDAAIDEIYKKTPGQAQHAAYERFLERGVTGFQDSQGRQWTLEAYVDMAVRTAVSRAYNTARMAEAAALGEHYFTVSDDGDPCPLCQPWQNVILTDATPDNVAQSTITEASAAGLFHPRCKHVLTQFFPGVSVRPSPRPWTAEDQKRYDESQRQRLLERRIRAAKRVLAGALDDAMRATARRRLRDAQAAMREFIDQTGRVRIPRREQLHL